MAQPQVSECGGGRKVLHEVTVKKKKKGTSAVFGQVENFTQFSVINHNPIVYIYPISIKRTHQDLSFKGCQIADHKLREISRSTWAPCLYQSSGKMIDTVTCCIPHSDCNQAEVVMSDY